MARLRPGSSKGATVNPPNSRRDADRSGREAKTQEVAMTTLDTLGTADPDLDEVADAALAMADFDAKSGDCSMALDWLAVAAHHRELTREYLNKRSAWEASVGMG